MPRHDHAGRLLADAETLGAAARAAAGYEQRDLAERLRALGCELARRASVTMTANGEEKR